MPLSIKHTFVSAIPDGPDNTVVQPSDWNAEHTIEAPGSDTQVIFNDGGTFGADSGMVYDKTNDVLKVKSWQVRNSTEEMFTARSTNKFNLFIGLESGINCTTDPATAGGADGTANTAVGYQTLKATLTTARYNAAFGTHAGSAITSGDSNVLIGPNAGLSITTGNSNTLVGHDCGGLWTSTGVGASGITAVGYLSASAVSTTGTFLTAVGMYALQDCTDGQYNCAFGYNALSNVTSGDNNVGVGLGAGSTLTTGNSNIFIGTYAEPTANSSSNQCVIGSEFTQINDMFVGKGVAHATPTGIIINATGGSGSNVAGAAITIAGGRGTGTGVGGSFKVQVAPAGSSGSSQNALTDSLVINSTHLAVFTGAVKTLSTTFASLPSAATAGSGARAFITDCNSTAFLATAAGGGSNKVPVVSDGTNWLIG